MIKVSAKYVNKENNCTLTPWAQKARYWVNQLKNSFNPIMG